MDCTLASNVILFGGVALGALVGYAAEYVLTARGYKPKNYFATWRVSGQTRGVRVVPLNA